MKCYSRFSNLMILMVLFIPNSLTHALTRTLYIHELVDESDIVFIGTVTGVQYVIDNIDTQYISSDTGGNLYSIRIDKVLYGKEEIKEEIFSESNVRDINMKLKRNRKRNPVKLFAYRSQQLRGTGLAVYYKNESQLFFLKVSKFRETLPDTVVILDEDWSLHESQSQLPTKSDLTEKFYFEACFGVRQSTWLLAREKQKKKLPTVEAFCEVMSIGDLVQREQRFRELLNSDNARLIMNAKAALRKIEQAKKVEKKQTNQEQKK